MTEYIRNHDSYLNPPDPPTHSPCDRCHTVCDNDDLWEVEPDYWLCEDCKEEWNAEQDNE